MKKSLLLTAFVFVALAATAEPRAIGLRIGADLEASYQHGFNDTYLQIDAGLNGYKGVGVVISYNWTADFATNWYVSYGIGAGGGYDWYKSHEWRHKYDKPTSTPGVTKSVVEYDPGKAGYFGVVGNFALEYQLPSFPLAFDVNYRPMIGFLAGDTQPEGYHDDKTKWGYLLRGLWDVTLGVRYVF
ncbi:MAG: hypothetical protein IJ680_09095 [Paludibacteraceae bacterium]|nr:hypothetical protein [Paludibacteraceae bacterium]